MQLRAVRTLVTGASGKTGRAVTTALTARGVSVLAVIRPESDNERVCREAGADDVARVDLGSGEGMDEALRGVDVVYHLAPNVDDREVEMAVRVARAADRTGVHRFGFHSVLHPADASMPHHVRKHLAENKVREIIPGATVLRPAAYQDNLVPAALAGEISVPYSLDAPFTNVALADVAEAAAVVLTDAGHGGRTYDLVGPQTLTVREMAEVATEVLRRVVSVREITTEDWVSGPGAGLPVRERDELAAMFRSYDREGLTGDSDDLARLLGRPPSTWAQTLARLL